MDVDNLQFYITKRRGKRKCYKEVGILLDSDIENTFKNCRWTLTTNNPHTQYVQVQRQIDGVIYTRLLHRLIMNCPEDRVIDHINGNGLDNRRENLRIVSIRENGNNMRRHREGKSVGIFYSKKDNLWVARIRNNGTRYSLDCYKTKEEAQQAYLKEKERLETT